MHLVVTERKVGRHRANGVASCRAQGDIPRWRGPSRKLGAGVECGSERTDLMQANVVEAVMARGHGGVVRMELRGEQGWVDDHQPPEEVESKVHDQRNLLCLVDLT